jgi:hypothetical protein
MSDAKDDRWYDQAVIDEEAEVAKQNSIMMAQAEAAKKAKISQHINRFDGLIHKDNGDLIDPVDGHKVIIDTDMVQYDE